MKNSITLISLILLVYAGSFAKPEQRSAEELWPAFVQYKQDEPIFKQDKISLKDATGKDAVISGLQLKQTSKDSKGMEHYRYQQHYNGYPIEHATWLVHVSNGKIKSQNGKLIKKFPDKLADKPQLSAQDALVVAMNTVGAKIYKWQIPSAEAFIKREQQNPEASYYPKPELVYYSGEKELLPAALKLAYKLDVYAQQPLSRQYIFIDAINGQVLGKRSLLFESNVVGAAQTAYSGIQTITTDFTGNDYRLSETGRGSGNGSIITWNMRSGYEFDSVIHFTDSDNFWNNINPNRDEYATDAHWATEMTYDYLLIKHNRNSYDGLGAPLNSYVHFGTNEFNAFWDGSNMYYGDGDAMNGYRPLTSLDVCGHEVVHGVTQSTSNLAYIYESGALNEAFSDIFGTAIEFYARPNNADWNLGGDFYTIRSMNNPNQFQQPDTYNGLYWYTGDEDNGGVHINSGVLNYWFYLLSNGGTGTNDHGYAYSVTGIGMDKAAAIAFRLNTVYLVSASGYQDARTLGIQAARDLFGNQSIEAIQTAEAFNAVGVYALCTTPPQNLLASVNSAAVTLEWDWVPSANLYMIAYKKAADTLWIAAGNTTLNSISINGLDAAALYDWKVRAVCSSDTSENSFAQFNTATPACSVPINNTVAFGVNNRIVLGWNSVAGANSYRVQLKLQQNTWENLLRDTVITDTSVIFAPFNSGVSLTWRVRSVCADNWSSYQLSQFTTPCPPISNLSAGSVTTSSALLSWTASGANTNLGRDVYYKVSSSANWTKIGSNIGTNSFQLTGLFAGRTYDAKVVQRCESSFSTEVQLQFSTLCTAIPASIQVSEITTNRARLSWNSIAGAVSYTIQYKKSSETTWTTLTGITSAQYILSALTANTTYQVQIKAVCASGSSAFSNTITFNTYCTSSGLNSAEWIDLFTIGSIYRISTAETGGYVHTGLATNLVIGSSGNAAQVSAGFSRTIKAQLCAVYIDFNRNGSYSDPGEQVLNTITLSNASTVNFSINIPSAVLPGWTGMRVVMLQKANGVVMGPCVNGKKGETEDYFVNLVAGSALQESPQNNIAYKINNEAVMNDKAVNPEAGFRIFPNPSSGRFIIELPSSDYVSYDVYSVQGEILEQGSIGGAEQFVVNISANPVGLYFIRLREISGKMKVLKLFKN